MKMSALEATTDRVPTVQTTARILDLVVMGQRTDPRVPLLIRGEPGVGKDILARLIHAATARQPYSFIKVNCAGQPEDRVQADLFGHEKGASPLAVRRRLGSFEFANGGTIYLDEIGALPRVLVPTLMRVLRTGEVSRPGGCEIIRVDGRVIASTVQSGPAGGDDDLWQELRRLNVAELWIPPLRDRRNEIPVFASFFLERFNRRYRRNVQLSSDVLVAFGTHAWPGNIRELEQAVLRLVVGGTMSTGP
jgi:Nif-specific regulatory protein